MVEKKAAARSLQSRETPRIRSSCSLVTPLSNLCAKASACMSAVVARALTHTQTSPPAQSPSPPPFPSTTEKDVAFSLPTYLDSHRDGEGGRGGLLRRSLPMDNGGLVILRWSGRLLHSHACSLYSFRTVHKETTTASAHEDLPRPVHEV